MRARVYVTLKPSVFDPQGRVVADALVSLGYQDVKDVRQGKFFEVELETGDPAAARARVGEMADKLLANPVIESYRVEILEAEPVVTHGRSV
jgi:phosphoribosylformylglycinamidine synthase PurS subunit